MWILSWKTYKLSKFATFISILGALTRYGGVLCFFYGVIPAGLLVFGIGILPHFLAEAIAFGRWKAKVAKEGYDQRIRQGDLNLALQLYKGNASEKTLKYFASLNPQLAQTVRTTVNKPAAKSNSTAAKPAPAPAPKPVQPNPQSRATAEASVRCAKCGTVAAPGNKFCPECGYSLIPESPKQKTCSNCGEVLASNVKFCVNCGSKQ